MEGGSKASSEIHDRVKAKLESEFGFSKEEASAVKSILWDMCNEKGGSNDERSEYLEKLLTKTNIKKITDKMITDRLEKIRKFREEKKAAPPAGKKKSSKKVKKVVKKTKASKKVSKKAGKKASKKVSKKASKKSSKKVSKKTSKKVKTVSKKSSKKASKKASKKN